ncbi:MULTISPECIES: HD domain-containing protein [Chryseobacterium]|uniref:HD superfamily phosphohydrolase n=1 Tax=Chryseobacterium geocarposphaerae TaxID=1416776 RepID=A0ABU1LBV1_9FLAO|nr:MULTISPECIES: HD domain-containing protein [Chryseobacterium]MDR6404197.1 HD superfamily phosphohydrolase [Chryseobacterium geocarposphaerae]MDR6700018.1 HD superfamily phosphohydrolase [Chryseobacterium ginsenosidimutans]
MHTGNILDPIHGLIKLSEIEKWVISQKPFNRLKRIKQNTFLYLVFPSSNHTRFEHSIGVMHLAYQIYINSNNNYLAGNYKKKKYKSDSPKDFEFCSVKDILGEKEDIFIQELRLAALLHDVGHGPMAHKFDQYTLTGKELFEILKSEEDLNKYDENFKNIIKNEKKRVNHETISCLFIIKIIENLKNVSLKNSIKFSEEENLIIKQLDPIRIIKMIEPKFSDVKIEVNSIDMTDYFNSIISSFPLDADRMDYLYRDSYFSGVKYGIYDLSRLLMSFVPIKIKNKITLCIKESGIDSVIRFIQSRTHLYNQVYFHKTNRAANLMLDFICKDIVSGKSVIDAKTYLELENFYWENSDEIFLWNTLKNKLVTGTEKLNVLNELLERKLWKRVYQTKIVITPTDKIENLKNLKEIKQQISDSISKLKDKNIYVAVDNFPNKVFKDEDKSKIKIAKKTDNNYIIEEDWKNFNKELKILECEIHMFRIYLRRQFNTPEEFTDYKNQILIEFAPIIQKLNEIK